MPFKQRPDHYLLGVYRDGFRIFEYRKSYWQNLGAPKGYKGDARTVIEDKNENFWVSHARGVITKVTLSESLDSAISVIEYDSAKGLEINNWNHVLNFFPDGSDFPLVASGSNYFQYDSEKDNVKKNAQ